MDSVRAFHGARLERECQFEPPQRSTTPGSPDDTDRNHPPRRDERQRRDVSSHSRQASHLGRRGAKRRDSSPSHSRWNRGCRISQAPIQRGSDRPQHLSVCREEPSAGTRSSSQARSLGCFPAAGNSSPGESLKLPRKGLNSPSTARFSESRVSEMRKLEIPIFMGVTKLSPQAPTTIGIGHAFPGQHPVCRDCGAYALGMRTTRSPQDGFLDRDELRKERGSWSRSSRNTWLRTGPQ